MRLLKTCNKTNDLSYVIKSSSASVKWSLHCPFDQLSVNKSEKKKCFQHQALYVELHKKHKNRLVIIHENNTSFPQAPHWTLDRIHWCPSCLD